MQSRVALVTGGTGGIGTSIIRRLAQSGHKVATNYRDEARGRAWQEKMKADMVMAVPEEIREKIVAQIPTGRLGTPDEIAYAVGFFIPDEAGWITGANLSANGGQYMGW